MQSESQDDVFAFKIMMSLSVTFMPMKFYVHTILQGLSLDFTSQ